MGLPLLTYINIDTYLVTFKEKIMNDIVNLINWQGQQSGYGKMIFKTLALATIAGRNTALSIYRDLINNWLNDPGATTRLKQVLVNEYDNGVKLHLLYSGGSLQYLKIFDVWALAVIDESLTKLGDPAYSDVNIDALVTMVKKTAAWSVKNSGLTDDNAP